jgi:arylsulfatase A-like enzyme
MNIGFRLLKLPNNLVTAVAGLLVVVAAAFLLYFQSSNHKQPRLVLLIATCTVNKDYLSPYNANVSTTPFWEHFAREALVFENHYSETVQSGVANASIFSGNQATRHGVFTHPQFLQLTPEVLHVPLIIRGPKYGVPAGRYSGITRSIDILFYVGRARWT